MSHQRGNPAVSCTGETFGPFTVKRRAGSMGQTSTWWCLDARTGGEVIKSRQELRRVKLKEERSANRDNPGPVTAQRGTEHAEA